MVTVSDTGRNWSDQEVRALIQVWADRRVCRQLESSTRKRDIFVQISNRLMQQGIERDWKQCHTKYKNLKYLYRSLQRGKGDEADPRRLMRFYDEVDAIMNRTRNGSEPHGDSAELLALEDGDNEDGVRVFLTKPSSERTYGSESVSPVNEDEAEEHRLDEQHGSESTSSGPRVLLRVMTTRPTERAENVSHTRLMSFADSSDTRIEKRDSHPNRGTKRKNTDQGLNLLPAT